MLIIDNFNQTDQKKIDNAPKSFKVVGLVYCILLVPASFLFGLLGLTPKGHGYWITTLSFLVVFTLVAVFSVIKAFLLYRKDMINKKKYKGTIRVVDKSLKKGDKTIFTDSIELKKLDLLTNNIFDKVDIGDQLTIEISKYSKTLLRLEKNGADLLNGH
jgi:hypothetical protein